MKQVGSLVFLLFLSACTMGPDYHTPPMNLPPHWENNLKGTNTLREECLWWETYNDPLLNDLIREAARANLDLKIASARIRQARASLLGAEASLYPEVDLSGSLTHTQNSFSAPSNPETNRSSNPSSRAGSRRFDLYKIGFDAGWEIDVFGRLRRAEEVATATLESQIEESRDLFLTLIAEIAQNYITLRSSQQQLETTKKSYKDWTAIYHLNQDLCKAGLVSEIEVAQAKAFRDQAKATLPPLEATIKSTIHILSILSGKNPSTLYVRLTKVLPLPRVPFEIFTGLPSDLLKRRPDIRQAERNLAAATAQIGLAVGELFPKFSLTGTLGSQSEKGSKVASAQSIFYSVGPSFSWPVLDFGRVKAQIEAQTAAQQESFCQYEKTILNALKEVEDALVRYRHATRRYQDLKVALEASQVAFTLSKTRFQSGLLNFIEVLQSEITLQNNHLAMLQSQAALLSDTVALYKALGGGWQVLLTNKRERLQPIAPSF